MNDGTVSGFHHVELWLHDLGDQLPAWDWLFERLGWTPYQDWQHGRSWRAPDGSYLVIEESPDLATDVFDRTRAGVNHLALNTTRDAVDAITAACGDHGWSVLFGDRHPHAGGPDHYAAYLENAYGFEIELVAT
ncbi:VOC family protein [Microlunatus soli]|uniref:Glyoxalase/Bleomycin resistance protein/Dioxygenase superfamily protein n=1 Tax=Microlunatus soli TaxID=630515 RepID=A0A1H1ZCL5_9ACTN|nr:VOC family protein [Microlunatus soli]SDT31252.1 Glyoxalase/Bleomycin resistance protein/Dioxygenase superfamily protein [Microlunatus soli]